MNADPASPPAERDAKEDAKTSDVLRPLSVYSGSARRSII